MTNRAGMHLDAGTYDGEAPSDVAIRIPADHANLPLIALVVEHLHRGGVQQMVALLCSRFDRKRYRLAVLTLKRGDEMRPVVERAGVPVHFLPVHHLRDWNGLRELAHWYVKHRPAIVHTHSYFANHAGRIAAAMASHPVVIAHYHNVYERQWDRRGLALERLLGPRTDCFVMVSGVVAEEFHKRTRIPRSKARLIYNGIDLEPFGGPDERQIVRNSLGAGQEDMVICAVASLVPRKNLETLIEAAARVAAKIPAARFWLLGDGEERERLEQLAVDKRLGDRFLFLGMSEQVPRHLRAADILVSTSLIEGFPLNVLEGMAAGLAVVATPAGGTEEAIADGQNGRIFPFRDIGALSGILVDLCRSPDTRRRLGEAGRQTVAERFTVERWRRDIETLYAEILQKKASQLDAWRALTYFQAAQRVRARAFYWSWRVRLSHWGI